MELSNEKLREIIQQAVCYGVYSERFHPFVHDFYHESQEPTHLYVSANEYADTVIKLLTYGKNGL